jgi:hypothetical protein
VVAGAYHIRASVKQTLQGVFGKPKTTGRIFTIDYRKIGRVSSNQGSKMLA